MNDPADLAELLEAAAVVLRAHQQPHHWIDLIAAGEIILTDEAATVANLSTETIRRRCEASMSTDKPIAVLLASSVYLVSMSRLLADIERRAGRPAMLEAQSRAHKLREMRQPPQESLPNRAATTG